MKKHKKVFAKKYTTEDFGLGIDDKGKVVKMVVCKCCRGTGELCGRNIEYKWINTLKLQCPNCQGSGIVVGKKVKAVVRKRVIK